MPEISKPDYREPRLGYHTARMFRAVVLSAFLAGVGVGLIAIPNLTAHILGACIAAMFGCLTLWSFRRSNSLVLY